MGIEPTTSTKSWVFYWPSYPPFPRQGSHESFFLSLLSPQTAKIYFYSYCCEQKIKKTQKITSILVASPPFTIGTVFPAWILYCPTEWPFKLRIGFTDKKNGIEGCITHHSISHTRQSNYAYITEKSRSINVLTISCHYLSLFWLLVSSLSCTL